MPQTLVMTFLDFAEAEGYNAALGRIEDIQAALTDILEASDQPLHQLYASSLLLAVNDIAIVLNHSYLKEIQHRAALAKGSIEREATTRLSPPRDANGLTRADWGVDERGNKLPDDDNPISYKCAECGQYMNNADNCKPYRCIDCIGRDA